ncbi:39S ribosomal protein L46, mitochondrial [Lutzomyia longipalpis]|uniref:39S ribosomal protein L46, mitochondrial n=1 Tax=Lutzomyia longipalpis TaxID=7200 RepID=UPI0024845DFD|nr:39S ribosomal protein L46, mitochondrial [Lutzomyia longipalpis]
MLKSALLASKILRVPGVRLISQNPALRKEKWDLLAGVLVERLPILGKSLNPIETKYQKMLMDVEFEQSLLSDHERRHEKDILLAESIKKGLEVDLDDVASKQTAEDFEDACDEELEAFKLASRQTEADRKKDFTSVQRKLEDTLFLLVEQTVGNKKIFLLPQGVRQEGETMRQTADRVLREICGEKLNVQVYGNAPVGFYKYKYPQSQRKEAVGAKVFFFRAAHLAGNPGKVEKSEKGTGKFLWHTKEEIEGKLPPEYMRSVQQFLL